jgi:hypothetical protein
MLRRAITVTQMLRLREMEASARRTVSVIIYLRSCRYGEARVRGATAHNHPLVDSKCICRIHRIALLMAALLHPAGGIRSVS